MQLNQQGTGDQLTHVLHELPNSYGIKFECPQLLKKIIKRKKFHYSSFSKINTNVSA